MEKKKIQKIILWIVAIAAIVGFFQYKNMKNQEKTKQTIFSEERLEELKVANKGSESRYSTNLMKWKTQGVEGGKDEIILSPDKATLSGDAKLQDATNGKTGQMIYTGKENNSITWNFTVETEGLYNLELDYMTLDGNGSKVQRSLYLDGELPYDEARNIYLYRRYIEDGNVKINSIGDEVWPKQEEELIWQTVLISDAEGYFEDPLMLYLTKGNHTVTLEHIDQALAVSEARIVPTKEILSFEELRKTYESNGYQEAAVESTVEFQAENSAYRNDSVIRRENNTDPNTVPYNMTSRVLNVLGGYRWRVGNQQVTWKFNVPEDGLYKINMKVAQSTDAGMPSYRQIEIDGEIPFEEMKLYRFEYRNDWYGETLSNEKGEAYLFYLTEGTHELSMTVKIGPFKQIIEQTIDDVSYLSDMTRDITKIIGTEPDPNYEYELYRTMPGLSEELTFLADRLTLSADLLSNISNQRTSMENNYRQIIDILRGFAKDVDTIPKALGDLSTAQTNLGTYITSIKQCPLSIDYISISSPQSEFIVKQSSFWAKSWVTISNFLLSFTKDYDSVGRVEESETENIVLDVWIARGAEWGELLKEMADEQFTPETGITINLNVIPGNQLTTGSVNTLMLSITSGNAPDVALSVDYNLPSEFAFREAAVDLTKFPDFNELASQFYENSFAPYGYKDGIYAIPETMDFTVMMYRKDIMEELGVDIPKTWDELLAHALPVLYENNMSFALPVDTSVSSNSPGALRAFTMLLLQKNGSYYTEDGEFSALDSAQGYSAFKMWTDLYSNYGVDEESNFFTRMRTGTMPIGIGNYTTYMQLLTSAPELYGRWGVAPVPGIPKEDGTINNTVGTMSSTASIILAQSDKQEAAWKFLQWWMSEETQMKYGRELEALLGTGARWNTANVEAFYSLPWSMDDISIIRDQMEAAVEQPIVPGGYFTGRHIINAWNRVILNSENARDSLEEAVKDINQELLTKRIEFGLEE